MLCEETKIQFIEANQNLIEQINAPVKHTFAPGVCIREVFVPGGSNVISHRHKTTHTNIIVKGRVLLRNDKMEWDDLIAPVMFVAPPGRKVLQFIEDTVWLNIFPTNNTDVETVEDEFLDKTEAWEEGAEKVYTERAISKDIIYGIANKWMKHKGRIYACGNIEKDEIICTSFKNIKYSKDSNAAIIDNMLVATRDIKGNIGGLRGEEITIEVRS